MTPSRVARVSLLAVMLGCALALTKSAGAVADLSTANVTPLPASKVIVGAHWTSRRYAPPANQWGDILPTVWADDGNEYTMMDDGGTDVPISGGVWRQSLARITGTPPKLHFSHVGDPNNPPAHTFGQILQNPSVWTGPLGPFYSSGLVSAQHALFATQQYDWDWGANGPFAGLDGIAYSLDYGRHWQAAGKPFPAPLGNLSWVIRGKGGFYADGWVYAIGTEREFNASTLVLGRARPDVADMTNPSMWQWASGWTQAWPQFSSSFSSAVPVLSWSSHLTYPEMIYDSPIHRYLLTFSYSYTSTPPGIWRNGADLVIAESPHPWGPFSFVAHEPYFGPSNGYGAGFPVGWISRDGRNLWMKWTANFDGCQSHLDCSGGYGFNYRSLHLTLAGDRAKAKPHPAPRPKRKPRTAPRHNRKLGMTSAPPARRSRASAQPGKRGGAARISSLAGIGRAAAIIHLHGPSVSQRRRH
jgi:hypothetical protein